MVKKLKTFIRQYIYHYHITRVNKIFNMPSQLNTQTIRTNQVAFTYSCTTQTFIWFESFKREKLTRPTLRRSKSVFSGLDKQ
jgi:hypothetical protein